MSKLKIKMAPGFLPQYFCIHAMGRWCLMGASAYTGQKLLIYMYGLASGGEGLLRARSLVSGSARIDWFRYFPMKSVSLES